MSLKAHRLRGLGKGVDRRVHKKTGRRKGEKARQYLGWVKKKR